jgi:hypothetical protein
MTTASLYQSQLFDSYCIRNSKNQYRGIGDSPEASVISTQGNADSLLSVANGITLRLNNDSQIKLSRRTSPTIAAGRV